jgi:acetolactate synthase I/II/III large subunit
MKLYEHLARLLADAGVRTVFGVMGDGNMHWLAQYQDIDGCTFRPMWHEAGAVWAADGYAAATGEVGVATVTMGPGLAQALGALTTAARGRHSVLLVTASLPSSTPPQAQEAHQSDWVRACGARYVAVHSPADLDASLNGGLDSARVGEVTVLAVDVQLFTQSAQAVQPAAPAASPPATTAARADDLDAAVRVLAEARRPVIIIGRGVRAAGVLPDVLDLGRRLGAAFATTLGGRIALPGEEFALGLIGMMADPLTRSVAAIADVLVVLGANLDRYNTDGATLGRDAAVVRIDTLPADRLWSPSPNTVHCTGELATTLPSLTELLGHRVPGTRTGLRTHALLMELSDERERQNKLGETHFDDGANPWAMVAELDAGLPPDSLVVVGIGHFWYFATPYLRPEPNRSLHYTSGFGLIGQALPTAIGATLALQERGDERTVVAVEGDGSLPMNVQELQAAVRHRADLLLVVLDNQAYGSEYHKLALAGLDVASSQFDDRPFPVCAVAEAMGATARLAGNPDQLRAALAELVPMRGVRVVDVRIARSPMSEAYLRQHGAADHESSH